jgi:hypothetical protein
MLEQREGGCHCGACASGAGDLPLSQCNCSIGTRKDPPPGRSRRQISNCCGARTLHLRQGVPTFAQLCVLRATPQPDRSQ